MILRIFVLVAGVMGAAGVILAAAAAHGSAASGLGAASEMLLFHAVAIMAGIGLIDRGYLMPVIGRLALLGWALGAALFAGDIAARAFLGSRLFPMAAPTGGSTLILAWVVLAVGSAFGLIRRE